MTELHRLVVVEPGHFHAALLLRDRTPRVDRVVHVYGADGPGLDDFVDLVAGFNSRADAPTDWDLHVHRGPGAVDRAIGDRYGEIAVLAGRNDSKLSVARQFHDAGFGVLADKPWLISSSQLPDLEALTAGPPMVMDVMTERHSVAGQLRHRLVTSRSVFGDLEVGGVRPALEFESVHHLCKDVDGRSLRRPPWFYDVDVQGDGLVDIHSHMVDQAQWLIGATGRRVDRFTIDAATRWSTPVTSATFEESTGDSSFPVEISGRVADEVLQYACNGQIDYRLGGVRVRQRTDWRHRAPAGGGDVHWSVCRGTRAVVTVRHDPAVLNTTQVRIEAGDPGRLEDDLRREVDQWRLDFPGLDIDSSGDGFDFLIPDGLLVDHEKHFTPVLNEFLHRVEDPNRSIEPTGEIRTRYSLIARARDDARDIASGANGSPTAPLGRS